MNSEHTAKTFSKVVAAAILLFAASALILCGCVKTVHAQGSGVVGIQSQLVTVWSAVTSTQCSSVLKDIGQGSNILFVAQTAPTGGSALIDFEWSPTGSAPFYTITQSLYGDQQAATHVLTVNGYFPNLRTCLTYTAGTYSAWYTATSGPLSYASPAVGTFGPTSPPVCDQWSFSSTPTATSGAIGPAPQVASTDQVVICGIYVSFNGATAAGSLAFQWAGSACVGPTAAYTDFTTAGTPQQFAIPVGLRSFASAGSIRNTLCLNNTSGATANVLVYWASLHTS